MTPKIERKDINELLPFAHAQMSNEISRMASHGRHLVGVYGDIKWICSQDSDGQIELSISCKGRRPNNYDVMRCLTKFGWTYVEENSRKVGKVRHFIIQAGRLN